MLITKCMKIDQVIGDFQSSDKKVERPRKKKYKNIRGLKIIIVIKNAVAGKEGSNINNEIGLPPP